jgi:hypothetical protein
MRRERPEPRRRGRSMTAIIAVSHSHDHAATPRAISMAIAQPRETSSYVAFKASRAERSEMLLTRRTCSAKGPCAIRITNLKRQVKFPAPRASCAPIGNAPSISSAAGFLCWPRVEYSRRLPSRQQHALRSQSSSSASWIRRCSAPSLSSRSADTARKPRRRFCSGMRV